MGNIIMAHPDQYSSDTELRTRCSTCCFAVAHSTDQDKYWCTVHPTWTLLPRAAVHDHYCGQYMPEYLDEPESSSDADPS